MRLALVLGLGLPGLFFPRCHGEQQARHPPDVEFIPDRYIQMPKRPAAPPRGKPPKDDVEKYDDAEYHEDSVTAAHLPAEHAGTHIGMFLAWAVTRDLVVDDGAEWKNDLAAIKERRMTGRQFLFKRMDGKLFSINFTAEGRAFAAAYYSETYLTDYTKALGAGLPSDYHVKDTWESFDKLAPVIDRRFEAWKAGRKKKTP